MLVYGSLSCSNAENGTEETMIVNHGYVLTHLSLNVVYHTEFCKDKLRDRMFSVNRAPRRKDNELDCFKNHHRKHSEGASRVLLPYFKYFFI